MKRRKPYKQRKYVALKNIEGVKKGYIFEWDDHEYCYTTKQMFWMLTPLIEPKEMDARVKFGQFKEITTPKRND